MNVKNEQVKSSYLSFMTKREPAYTSSESTAKVDKLLIKTTERLNKGVKVLLEASRIHYFVAIQGGLEDISGWLHKESPRHVT